MNAVVINTGSSSVRLSRWRIEGSARTRESQLHLDRRDIPPADALHQLGDEPPSLVAHRVVHGGQKLVAPVVIDRSVEVEIDRLAPLAPLHNPTALRWIQAARECFGRQVPQVAVFDTAFFASLPVAARTYALPRDLCERLG